MTSSQKAICHALFLFQRKENLMGTAERRLEIYKYLCLARKATMPQLAKIFGVSVRTIQRDIFEIEIIFHAPLRVTKGRYGGISVIGNHTLDRAYMCDEELCLLQKIQVLIKDQITDEENNMLSQIIKKYSKGA